MYQHARARAASRAATFQIDSRRGRGDQQRDAAKARAAAGAAAPSAAAPAQDGAKQRQQEGEVGEQRATVSQQRDAAAASKAEGDKADKKQQSKAQKKGQQQQKGGQKGGAAAAAPALAGGSLTGVPGAPQPSPLDQGFSRVEPPWAGRDLGELSLAPLQLREGDIALPPVAQMPIVQVGRLLGVGRLGAWGACIWCSQLWWWWCGCVSSVEIGLA